MIKKPIKNADGKLKEFTSTDELPNQPDIEELREALGLIVLHLIDLGLDIEDERLLNLLNNI